MSEPAPDRARLEASLRRVWWSVLGLVAVCAAVAATRPNDAQAGPGAPATYLAVGLATLSVLARRQATLPHASLRRQIAATLVSLAAAGGVALVGAVVAITRSQQQTGLLFCLAALIFSLRPPRLSPGGAPRSR